MSHETHHHTDTKPGTASGAAFWFMLILVGLFIGTVNFVNVMGHDDGESHDNSHDIHAPAGHGADLHNHNANDAHEGGH